MRTENACIFNGSSASFLLRRTVSRPGLTDHYEEMFLKRQVYTDGNPEISSSSSSSSTLEYWLWLIAVAAILLLFISLLRGRRSITETNTPSKTTGKRRVKKE